MWGGARSRSLTLREGRGGEGQPLTFCWHFVGNGFWFHFQVAGLVAGRFFPMPYHDVSL